MKNTKMANIQIADLAQVENQFDELSDLELVKGGYYLTGYYQTTTYRLGGLFKITTTYPIYSNGTCGPATLVTPRANW